MKKRELDEIILYDIMELGKKCKKIDKQKEKKIIQQAYEKLYQLWKEK